MKVLNAKGGRQVGDGEGPLVVVESMVRLASPFLCGNGVLRSPAFKM